jgi:hypothetical protein
MGGDADAVLRRAARFGDGWAPWQTRPEDFPAKLDYLKSQPGYDGRPFALFFSLASLNIGVEHEINGDPVRNSARTLGRSLTTATCSPV